MFCTVYVIENSYDLIEEVILDGYTEKHPVGIRHRWAAPELAVGAAVMTLYRHEFERSFMRELGEDFLMLEAKTLNEGIIRDLEKALHPGPEIPATPAFQRCEPLAYIILLRAIYRDPRIVARGNSPEPYLDSICADLFNVRMVPELQQCIRDVQHLMPSNSENYWNLRRQNKTLFLPSNSD